MMWLVSMWTWSGWSACELEMKKKNLSVAIVLSSRKKLYQVGVDSIHLTDPKTTRANNKKNIVWLKKIQVDTFFLILEQ